MVISCVLHSVLRSWVPLGETHWRITSPFRSPAQSGPRPTTVLWTPTMSKLYFIIFFTFFLFALVLHSWKHQLIADSGLILFSLCSVRLFSVFTEEPPHRCWTRVHQLPPITETSPPSSCCIQQHRHLITLINHAAEHDGRADVVQCALHQLYLQLVCMRACMWVGC